MADASGAHAARIRPRVRRRLLGARVRGSRLDRRRRQAEPRTSPDVRATPSSTVGAANAAQPCALSPSSSLTPCSLARRRAPSDFVSHAECRFTRCSVKRCSTACDGVRATSKRARRSRAYDRARVVLRLLSRLSGARARGLRARLLRLARPRQRRRRASRDRLPGLCRRRRSARRRVGSVARAGLAGAAGLLRVQPPFRRRYSPQARDG
ncbi:MAG: hypothetical protein JWM66_812 [Solirubrobacterales bacterium]|nr:hypothetical protein [Solirubrobacterales bacterium]